MSWSYSKLDNRGKFRRTIFVNFFAIIAIILIFLAPQIPLLAKVVFSLVIVIVGIYQCRRDYLNFQKKN